MPKLPASGQNVYFVTSLNSLICKTVAPSLKKKLSWLQKQNKNELNITWSLIIFIFQKQDV